MCAVSARMQPDERVLWSERILDMAKCENCGKTTVFGHNRSFSLRATRRTFRPNLQQVMVVENGRKTRKIMCAKCIRTMVKSA
jgi:large subunit ribosomal protein L28